MPVVRFISPISLNFWGPNYVFGMHGARHFTFGTQIDTNEYYSACVIDYPRRGSAEGHDLLWGKE